MPDQHGYYDANGELYQTFVPDPAKSQVNTAMTGVVTFKKDGTGTVNINKWFAIKIRPTVDVTWYYGADSTKVEKVLADEEAVIFVNKASVAIVTINFGAGTASVQGM